MMKNTEVYDLINKAKNDAMFIADDRDYYICVGYMWGLVLKTGKYMMPISHKYVNPLLNAASDNLLKNRFKQVKVREKPYGFVNNWKGNMLEAILTYSPEEKSIRHNDEIQTIILLGYLRSMQEEDI